MKKKLIPAFLLIAALANAEEMSLANFFKNTNVYGLARVGYENYSLTSESDFSFTNVRLRLYLDTKVNDNTNVVSSIQWGRRATGAYQLGSESNNEQDNRLLHFMHLYVNYKIRDNQTISVGRMDSPIYKISDYFLFDGEKDAVAYSTNIKGLKINTGYLFDSGRFWTDDVTYPNNVPVEVTDEQHTLYLQGVKAFNLGKNTLLVEGIAASTIQAKDSTDKNLNTLSIGTEYTHNLNSTIKMAKLEGEVVVTDADTDNKGYTLGVVLGDQNMFAKGAWQGELEYRYAETNSFEKTDSKNVEEVRLTARKNIMPKVNLEVAYTKSRAIDDSQAAGASQDKLDLSLLHFIF